MALEKTEATWLTGPRKRPLTAEWLLAVNGVNIKIGTSLKYLGLVLDSRWSFGPHFERVVPRALAVANSLLRLLPNTRGLKDGARRLHAGVVRSVAMYGAPIWHDALRKSRKNLALMRKAQRTITGRVIRGYRTIAGEAACALAGTPPWDITAEALASS